MSVETIQASIKERLVEIEAQLGELEPLRQEQARLEKALRALDGEAAGPIRRRAGGRQRDTRNEQVLQLLNQGRMSVEQIADSLGIGPTYLYKLLPQLEREGRVTKDGKFYALRVAAPAGDET
jgi:predicted Rossmann fold nucleotide-binding protein DprA/Smf involved in DNA uptake